MQAQVVRVAAKASKKGRAKGSRYQPKSRIEREKAAALPKPKGSYWSVELLRRG